MATGPEIIRERARQLPDLPGVYLYRDAAGDVLYVGKAKSLKKRVGSYARADRALERKTADLVLRVDSVEATVVGSEAEALLLEQSLIKEHRPQFNIRLRDDKSYPFIAVTVADRFPRVLFTRQKHRRGVRYFGPFPSASRTRETVDLLGRIFPFRPCDGPEPGRRSGSPCLDFHIGRCVAPCIGRVDEAGYRELIDGVIRVLEGDTRTIARELEREMLDAAEAHRFEDAARARNRLQAVRMLQEQNLVHRAEGDDADVVGVAREGDLACVLIFPLRGGRLGDRLVYTFENAAGATLDELVAAASAERYDAAGIVVPPLVLVPPGMEGVAAPLAESLRRRRGAAVEVRTAQRGEKRRLAELAARNAELQLRHELLQGERSRVRRFGALEELRDVLGLEVAPARIECFDISNTGERATVASMVVFEHGTPRKAHYRSFAITHGRLDDFASMAEAVGRRFARLASGDEDDPSFAALPDLVVIDGGKGQLGAAQRAIADLELPHVPMIGLAKRIEEIFLPDRPDPILLDVDAPGLLLLQRVRDEAHRFALGRHRIRRGREATASVIDQIPGIGPARRRALLTHFRDPSTIAQATLAELEAVPGLPRPTARAVYEWLHKAGGSAAGAAR